MLKDDRLGVIGDGSEDVTERIVGASLRMLPPDVIAMFVSLSIIPEDVPAPLQAVQLICEADPNNTNKASAVSLRVGMKKLLDRNLLQGSVAEGVQMHDIVRDVMRERLGPELLLAKQRALVHAVAAACPEDGWEEKDPLGKYMVQALRVHISEAMLADPLADTEAHAWLDTSTEPGHPFTRCAANAFGHECLDALAEQHKAKGNGWLAAKLFISASLTDGVMQEQSLSSLGEISLEVVLLMKACDVLSTCEETVQTRSFEIIARGRCCRVVFLYGRVKWADLCFCAGPR
jgi:hypothetical protein